MSQQGLELVVKVLWDAEMSLDGWYGTYKTSFNIWILEGEIWVSGEFERWYEASSLCNVVLGDQPKAEEREELADVDGDQKWY